MSNETMNQAGIQVGQGAAVQQSQAIPQPAMQVIQGNPNLSGKKPDSEQTKRLKENFGFFGPVTFLYACFYAFCMYKNGSGVTFPFFMAGSLWFICFSLLKLGIFLKKDSMFYMISMMLLSVSTFCTDDIRIIAFNKTGIFLLTMSLLLKQFFDTSKWRLGKYLLAMTEVFFASIGEVDRPIRDGVEHLKKKGFKKNSKVGYVILGVLITLPLFAIVLALLSSADAVFRNVTNTFLSDLNWIDGFGIMFRVIVAYFGVYMVTSYLCKHTVKEEVTDMRKGEPVLAITVTSMLTMLYLLFSGIQIVYLFLGQMQLPDGYTYAEYAREGFFQLLAVSILNLIIVLICLAYFKESKVLKVVLTIMSLCTYIMIASSALRMIIYIQYYYLTFLRILVLWALAVLFLLFSGVIISIFSTKFKLFQYSMVVVTVLYLGLSFCHPDYIIAKVNLSNAECQGVVWERKEGDFFKSSEPYQDYWYLSTLSADAAPVLIPYISDMGYDTGVFYEGPIENIPGFFREGRNSKEAFGYFYLRELQDATENFNWRTFNVSRFMALKQVERHKDAGDLHPNGKITFVNLTNYEIAGMECSLATKSGSPFSTTVDHWDVTDKEKLLQYEEAYTMTLENATVIGAESNWINMEVKVNVIQEKSASKWILLPEVDPFGTGEWCDTYLIVEDGTGLALFPAEGGNKCIN